MEKSEIVAVGVVLALFLTGYFTLGSRSSVVPKDNLSGAVGQSAGLNQPGGTPPALAVAAQVLKAGTGKEVKNGDTVSVHYVGTLQTGEKFDSSLDRGQPFTFTLGQGQVIAGWEIGLMGGSGSNLRPMKVGEKRRLVIPPQLAYGERGTPGGPIPPNATLVFEVELLGIK